MAGFSPHQALLWTFGLVALFPLVGALVTALFFDDPFGKAAASASNGVTKGAVGVLANLREVFAYARANKKYGLILFIGSVARTDTIVIGSFLGSPQALCAKPRYLARTANIGYATR